MIQVRVEAGVPVVGFSAGMIICGQNILTTNDDNECGSTEFTGLGFTKYNFVAHYPAGDGAECGEIAKYANTITFILIRS